MNSFYSIVYINSNVSTGERFGIGMFTRLEDKVYFRYSIEKLKLLKRLFNNAAYSLIKSYLKNLETKVNNENQPLLDSNFGEHLSDHYFSYLSKYANNLISFSEPKHLNIKNQENVQIQLFNKYIYQREATVIERKEVKKDYQLEKLEKRASQLEELVKRTEVKRIVSKNLYPKIKSRVNIDCSLTHNNVDNLLLKVKVGFIGKNGSVVCGQPMDFSTEISDLERNIGRFVTLIKAFDEIDSKSGKYFVIGKEPSKELEANHAIWHQVAQHNYIDFVPIAELNKIEEYINEKDVQPYVSETI